jgi:hypothetical protein
MQEATDDFVLRQEATDDFVLPRTIQLIRKRLLLTAQHSE